MESYQMFFPGSQPAMSAAAAADYMSNNAHLFAHFHGINNTIGDDHEVKEGALSKFDGHNLESNYNKFADDHESGPTCRTSEKNKTKLGKKQGNQKVRRHKFAFQTRSQVDVLDDGYRWRKYGQKTVKNSKFPRSYYKCTYQGCNVKKQIQRHCKDEGIVVTTYEGMHTHPTEKLAENFDQILKRMQTSYTVF